MFDCLLVHKMYMLSVNSSTCIFLYTADIHTGHITFNQSLSRFFIGNLISCSITDKPILDSNLSDPPWVQVGLFGVVSEFGFG